MSSMEVKGIIVLLVACWLFWVIWFRPWPWVPKQRIFRVATIVLFLMQATLVAINLIDTAHNTLQKPFGILAGTIGLGLCIILFLCSYNYRTKSKYLTLMQLRHRLTFDNRFDKEVMIMVSPLANSDKSDLEALTMIEKEQIKTIDNAVFLGQKSTVLAKDVTASEPEAVLFVRQFSEDELEKLNWTVVIEPGYEPSRPKYFQYTVDPFNPGGKVDDW